MKIVPQFFVNISSKSYKMNLILCHSFSKTGPMNVKFYSKEFREYLLFIHEVLYVN